MPTLKPRVSITMDAADLAVLDRYAAASGTPRASIISGLIHSTIPELDRAATLMELARAAPDEVIRGLVENLSNATADAMGFLQPFDRDYRQIMDALSRRLHEARGAGKVPESGWLDPHSLTGGSNS